MLVPLLAQELPPPNVLEWSFVGLLLLMTAAVGVLSLVVVARLVEPRGLLALLRRFVGKA
ncbi:MAG TPA: hypothetical protein VGB52_07825 [Actinomycetota bacterium]